MIMETVSFLVLLMVAISHVVFIRPVTGYVCYGYCFFTNHTVQKLKKLANHFLFCQYQPTKGKLLYTLRRQTGSSSGVAGTS